MSISIFTLTDKSYVSRAAFVSGHEKDMMVMLFKEDIASTTWIFRYRFRYYMPDPDQNPFDDDDKKSVWSAVVTEETEGKKMVAFLAAKVAGDWSGEAKVLDIDGDMATFMRIWSQQPWVHQMRIPKTAN